MGDPPDMGSCCVGHGSLGGQEWSHLYPTSRAYDRRGHDMDLPGVYVAPVPFSHEDFKLLVNVQQHLDCWL